MFLKHGGGLYRMLGGSEEGTPGESRQSTVPARLHICIHIYIYIYMHVYN